MFFHKEKLPQFAQIFKQAFMKIKAFSQNVS